MNFKHTGENSEQSNFKVIAKTEHEKQVTTHLCVGFAFTCSWNPGHFTFSNSREWNFLVPVENGNGAADGTAVI